MVAAPPPVRGRILIRIERCKGCEFCIEFCPSRVLVRSKAFNAKGYHYPIVTQPEVCINCTGCMTICPDYAILSQPVEVANDSAPSAAGAKDKLANNKPGRETGDSRSE